MSRKGKVNNGPDAAAPRQRGRTRGRTSKGSNIVFDCHIEVVERVFGVSSSFF